MTKEELAEYDKQKWEKISIKSNQSLEISCTKEEVESLLGSIRSDGFLYCPEMKFNNLIIGYNKNGFYIQAKNVDNWHGLGASRIGILESEVLEEDFQLKFLIHWNMEPTDKILLALRDLIINYKNFCFIQTEKLENKINKYNKNQLNIVEKAINESSLGF